MNAALCLCCVLLAQTADQTRPNFSAPAGGLFQRSAAPPAAIPADDKAASAPAANSPWTSAAAEQPKGGGTSLAPGRMFQSSQSNETSAPKTFGAPANDPALVPIKSAASTNSLGNSANAALTNNATTNTSATPAAQLMNEALTVPRDGAMTGRALTLLQALSKTSDRANQLRITRAYWRLTTAVADYYWTLEEKARLQQIDARAGTPDSAVAKSALASALARSKEAELAAVTAQHELAEAINQVPGEPLPVTTDAPYIGAYRTYFDKIFASRTAPSRVRLIDRTLPVRRDAIDARAQAVQGANDAAATAQDAYRRGQGDLHSVLSAQGMLRRERLAFLNAVRDYNYDIAEYALAAADGTVNEATLVGMLIKVKAQPNGTTSVMEPTPAKIAREPRGPQAAADTPEWRGTQPPTVGDEDTGGVRQATFEEEGEAKPQEPKVPFSVMVPPPIR